MKTNEGPEQMANAISPGKLTIFKKKCQTEEKGQEYARKTMGDLCKF